MLHLWNPRAHIFTVSIHFGKRSILSSSNSARVTDEQKSIFFKESIYLNSGINSNRAQVIFAFSHEVLNLLMLLVLPIMSTLFNFSFLTPLQNSSPFHHSIIKVLSSSSSPSDASSSVFTFKDLTLIICIDISNVSPPISNMKIFLSFEAHMQKKKKKKRQH